MPLPFIVYPIGVGVLALAGGAAAVATSTSNTSSTPDGEEEKTDPKTIPEATRDREQCYLLDGCFNIADAFKTKRSNFFPNNRICMVEDKNPEVWLNQMTYPDQASALFNKTVSYNETDFDFYIMKKTSAGVLQKIDVKKGFLGGETAATDASSSKKRIESISISYKGTTPASARSDISVKITIKVDDNLSALENLISSTDINTDEKTTFNLLDVIIRPEFLRDGTGLSKWKRSQFHPDYNRTELVIHNKFNDTLDFSYDKDGNLESKGGWSHSTSFALTMVDHELSVDEGGDGFTITLNYQSYVEQVIGLPYTDVFASTEVTKNRKSREEAISKAYATKNKQKIKEAKDNNKNKNKQEVEEGKQRILSRIQAGNLWYFAELGDDEVVPKVQSTFSGYKIEKDKIKKFNEKSVENYVQFVYLADLVAIAMDVFFVNPWPGQEPSGEASTEPAGETVGGETVGGDDYVAEFKDKLEIKTMFMNINLPNKDNKETPISLGKLPISKDFLEKFLEDNYTKKGLNYAPFQSFVRNLCEKAITKAISKVCFLDSDWKGRIKVDFFKALDETWNSSNATTGVKKFHETNQTSKLLEASDLKKIFNGKYGSIDPKKESEYTTYMIIHASEQAETSDLVNLALNDDTGGPFLILKDKLSKLGDKNKDKKDLNLFGNSLGTTFNFKRIDNKYRREAVYTEFKSGAFVAIGNVYSATINFKAACCNWFFPGNLVILDPNDGDVSKAWNDSTKIGNRLGITGIYLIKSVTHDLKFGKKDKSFSTKLEANWETSALGDIRVDNSDINPTEPQDTENDKEDGNPINGNKPDLIPQDGGQQGGGPQDGGQQDGGQQDGDPPGGGSSDGEKNKDEKNKDEKNKDEKKKKTSEEKNQESKEGHLPEAGSRGT